MTTYPVLRSGFVGLSMKGLRQPTRATSLSRLTLLDKQGLETVDDFFYHEAINGLFLKMLRDSKEHVMKSPEDIEPILLAAGEAFGTKNFWDWVIFQFTHGSITRMHSAFLIETLNFITGKERQTTLETWIRLLNATVDDEHVVTQTSLEYKGLTQLKERNLIPAQLSQAIVKWMRRPNGLYDFIYSLEIIFGNRRILSRGG